MAPTACQCMHAFCRLCCRNPPKSCQNPRALQAEVHFFIQPLFFFIFFYFVKFPIQSSRVNSKLASLLMSTLIVGDGNFSFACALLRVGKLPHAASGLTATSYDSKEVGVRGQKLAFCCTSLHPEHTQNKYAIHVHGSHTCIVYVLDAGRCSRKPIFLRNCEMCRFCLQSMDSKLPTMFTSSSVWVAVLCAA